MIYTVPFIWKCPILNSYCAIFYTSKYVFLGCFWLVKAIHFVFWNQTFEIPKKKFLDQNGDNSSLEIFQNHHLQILEPFWFINEEDGKPFNCDQQTYLEMLEDHFFLQLSAREIRKYWFQQDGKIKISICPYS